ncbi:helix-turn-helix transcriptional regulator, partial [Sinorhizobium meliloti]
MLSHDSIWRAIDALAERHRLSPSGLARRAGLDPTSFNKSKRQSTDGRDRWPSTESIAKILHATGASVDQFLALMEPNAAGSEREDASAAPGIPLIGFAQAGAGGFFDDGGFPVGQGWDTIEFPTPERRQGGTYALEVQGDSMLPLYRDGD